MTSPPEPLKITLEFIRTKNQERADEFSFERQEYRVRHADARFSTATIPWDEVELQQLRSELEKPRPDPTVLEKIGHRLRGFLDTKNWALDELSIEQALASRRQIDITIRSEAEELYYLPWELLSLERCGGRQLGELPGCLIRYDRPRGDLKNQAPRECGRILFASSTAGGGVPFPEHLDAIQSIFEKSGCAFDLRRDVLQAANRQSLARELNAADRPITALHLLCHGARSSSGAYGIKLDLPDPDEGTEVLDAAGFRKLLLATSNPPRLVTLCVCQSGDAGPPAHILGSIARRLHELGVPAVIASRFPLSERGSTLLTRTLYSELVGEGRSGSLREAISAIRTQLMQAGRSADWASLQVYAREGDEAAMYPFRDPPIARVDTPAPSLDLVLIRHEAFDKAPVALELQDAPGLFHNRAVRSRFFIDQTPELQLPSKRTKKRLEEAVKRLVSLEGELSRALAEQDVELVYYGFPLVPLAVLAGFRVKTPRVRLFEYDRGLGRFSWVREPSASQPPLHVEIQPSEAGAAVRLRLSVSGRVELDDCREVLPDSAVGLDLHFQLESPEKGIVRRAEQVQAYQELLRKTLGTHVEGKPRLTSIHVFAAVPVSVAFSLGQVLASTGLPRCYVYNYNAEEKPRYKWRLCLHAAVNGRSSIDIFK